MEGNRLKKIRLEKGISLEEIQKKTKIHPNILRAIEGDGISGLSPIYLKSFLKIYCKFLGLDYREYIGDYEQAREEEQAAKQPAVVKESPRRLKISSLRPNKKITKVSLIALAAFFLLFGLFKAGKAVFSKRSSARVPAVAEKMGDKKPKPAASLSSGIRLGIRARDNCWVTLKVDGRIVFQRVLTKGRFESWKAKDKMELSLGNAGAVELEVNGQVFSNLGRKGQALKNIVITRQGMEIPR